MYPVTTGMLWRPILLLLPNTPEGGDREELFYKQIGDCKNGGFEMVVLL